MENPDGASDVEVNMRTMQPTEVSSAIVVPPNECDPELAQSSFSQSEQCPVAMDEQQLDDLRNDRCESQLSNNSMSTERSRCCATDRRRATTFADCQCEQVDSSANQCTASDDLKRDESSAMKSGVSKGTATWQGGVTDQRAESHENVGEKIKPRSKSKRPVGVEKDSLRAWLTIASTCFFAYGMLYGTIYTFPVLYTALVNRFSNGSSTDGHSELISFRVSWIGSACFGMSNFLCVFSGILTELVSTQVLLLVGATAGALGILASAFVDRLELWYVTYVCITGMGNSCIYLAVVTVLSEHFERYFSLANGVTSLGSGVMQTVFPFVWQHLLLTYGLPAMLYFMSGCYASLILFVPLWRTPGDPRWFAVRRVHRVEESDDEDEDTVEMARSRSAEELTHGRRLGAGGSRLSGPFVFGDRRPKTYMRNDSVPVAITFGTEAQGEHKVSEGESSDPGQMVPRMVSVRTLHASLMQLPNAAARRMRVAIQRNAELSPLTKPLSLSLMTSISSSSSSIESGKAKCDWCKLTLFRNRRYVIFLVGMMLYEVGTAAPDMFIVSYTDDKFKTSEMDSLVPLISYSITMCVAKIGFSKLLSSFSKNLAISMWLFQLGPCLNGITMSLIPVFVSRMNSYPLMVFTCALWGLSDGPPDALLAPVIRLLVGPKLMARAVGYCVAICMTSAMLGPPLAGLILDTLRTYDFTFYLSSTLIFMGTCIFFVVNFVDDPPIDSTPSGTTECEIDPPASASSEHCQPLLARPSNNTLATKNQPYINQTQEVTNGSSPPITPSNKNSSSSSAYSTATVPSCVADTIC